MKILIPNATGPSNQGDQIILLMLLDLIKKAFPTAKVLVHSTDVAVYRNFPYQLTGSLYDYVLRSSPKNTTRLGRVCRLIFYLLALKLHLFKLISNPGDKIYSLIYDFQEADLIVFMGGGYLRAKKDISQTLNLILLLLVMEVAKATNKRTIVAPISFGPFDYPWQAKLAAHVLSKMTVVAAREKFAFELMKKMGLANLVSSSDHGLLLKRHKGTVTQNNNVVGFTIRNWSKDQVLQHRLEEAYMSALKKLQQKYNLAIQPIVQATLPDFPFEDDSLAVGRVYEALRQSGARVLSPVVIDGQDKALIVYSRLQLLLGMRMHSNIIAATQGVPFVAVSYEPKTEGITKELSMEKFCLRFEEVNDTNLYALLDSAYQQKEETNKILTQRLASIQSDVTKQWLKIFREGKYDN